MNFAVERQPYRCVIVFVFLVEIYVTGMADPKIKLSASEIRVWIRLLQDKSSHAES
jgi:hypothetical protein